MAWCLLRFGEGTMNLDRLRGSWGQLRGRARLRWAKLTRSDVDYVAGRRDVLIGKIQERYGKKREEAERDVEEWLARV